MIDPMEAVIQWLATALTGTQGRVSSKHQYGRAWQVNETGLAVYMDDGNSDKYAALSLSRLELRVYASSRASISDVAGELQALERSQQRFTVSTSKGTALIHSFIKQTGLTFLYDTDLRMDYGTVFYEVLVSEISVS